jgi:DNA replication initiation complex subunit (GINS family)
MLNYAVLRDIQKKESDSAAIVRLEPSFYSDAAQLISQKKADALESGSIMSIKEYENLRKIVASIQSRRE